jgi:asparagine synthase (glutamine-hydrolysing)
MCGIFGILATSTAFTGAEISHYNKCANNIQHRGPDNTKCVTLNDSMIHLVFHRLAINDLSEKGDQPLILDNTYYLICNGEIYNHEYLAKQYNIKTSGGSDCEIILHLYKRFGISKTLDLISGYFAFILYDGVKNITYVARDPIGVRSLYIGSNDTLYTFCSELKGLHDIDNITISQFKPGHYWDSVSKTYTMYYSYNYVERHHTGLESELRMCRELFTDAVYKRFMFERPFGVFLSGGLDSSLVAALVAKRNWELNNTPIHTFSIGFAGSTDLKNARLVASHIKSTHHEVIVTQKEMLNTIPDVIRVTETWDTTTIRASTPMYLLSKYIRENTDIAVIFSGEGSDEASGSYLYFHNAPSDQEFQDECVRLLKDLHYFDCLRCDKSTSANSLEVRVPFLDLEFLRFYMEVAVELKRPKTMDGNNLMEKWFLRKAFDGDDLLPYDILWRKKEAFSDGVSSVEKSWFQIIQEYVDTLISDDEFTTSTNYYKNKPLLKESYYYRMVFNSIYPSRDSIVPYYWLPKWSGDVVDPSARVLDVY